MADVCFYDALGKRQDDVHLDVSFDKKEENSRAFACAIRVLRQNWRQGTVGCKTRKDLAFSNRKPWKQKGTGRARAGSLRSPLWRKGAVLFGPQPRTRTLSMTDKQKKVVFNNILFATLEKKAIHCIDCNFVDTKPSTKVAGQALKNAGLLNKKVVVFLPFGDTASFMSFRNFPNVSILLFDQPNAFDLTNCDGWLFLKKDTDLFKEMIEKWN
ncbi:MAG: 50S ribosomal protein L4 [Candidatus Babeliales bacterium]|jgi:large subunit ribosomal protein L4